jgi:hypothetical protein
MIPMSEAHLRAILASGLPTTTVGVRTAHWDPVHRPPAGSARAPKFNPDVHGRWCARASEIRAGRLAPRYRPATPA